LATRGGPPNLGHVDGRAFGLRNTYSVVVSGGALSAEEAGSRLFGQVPAGGQPAWSTLPNGALLVVAAASRAQYVTPGCASPADLVVRDKAGERILEGLAAEASQRLRADGIAGDVSLLKVNPGPAGSSPGSQEDYLVARDTGFGRFADWLIPFLVTRPLICGAGAVRATPQGAEYCLSRPVTRTGTSRPSRANGPGPFITVRDEPRSEPGLVRLEVTAGEPSMSETTTLLKAGATSLVLRMAEAGTAAPAVSLDQPVRAFGEVSRDITGQSLLRLASGRTATALGVQREYLARATDFAARGGGDAASARVLRLWQRAVDAIEAGNLDGIAREIDWAVKYRLIEQYRAAGDLPLSAPEVAQADLAYHDISRRHGLYYQLQRDGAVARTARDIDIFEAKTVPPPGRRGPMGC
jgi:proteasome accessory factor A